MRTILPGTIVLVMLIALPAFAADPIPGEVPCDNGVEIARVRGLVKKTVEALKKDQASVIQQINSRDTKWKDGDLYVVAAQGTKILAHGYMPSLAGQDVGSTTYQNSFPWVRAAARMALEKGEGCIQYRFHNPAKGGQVEEKVTYVMKVRGDMWAGSGTYLVRK